MSAWRTVITDSESSTGVAPVCPYAGDPAKHTPNEDGDPVGPGWVFDCCPHPQVEMWDEGLAAEFARRLTEIDAQVCG